MGERATSKGPTNFQEGCCAGESLRTWGATCAIGCNYNRSLRKPDPGGVDDNRRLDAIDRSGVITRQRDCVPGSLELLCNEGGGNGIAFAAGAPVRNCRQSRKVGPGGNGVERVWSQATAERQDRGFKRKRNEHKCREHERSENQAMQASVKHAATVTRAAFAVT